MTFTTRPDIRGTFGVVATTHWIASAVGMRMLEQGGNAFDAAVAAGFALHVVEPHLNGPLGEMPALFRLAGEKTPHVLCGQGVAPDRATIAHYRAEGLDMVPGSGLLAAVVPGAFDAWMLLLRDHGTMRLRQVLEPSIHYARAGHPLLPRVSDTIAGLAGFFRDEWPSSAAVWMPGGRVPGAHGLFSNPDLADTWERLLHEAECETSRGLQIDAARRAFSQGFVGEAVDKWMAKACVMDATGERRQGVLCGQDMANWQAGYEAPLSVDYEGWRVWKAGCWSQGPVFLQALRLLERSGIDGVDGNSADFVHLTTEALKLAMADREAYYGDPAHTDIPMETLLSRDYAAGRRAQLTHHASQTLQPGSIAGFESWSDAAIARFGRVSAGQVWPGGGEPTMSHLSQERGDTVHIDVIDRWGNMISATPSGGWLQSSPIVPGLGMALNSRAQMFWLEDGLPTSLAPGRRPRTTLSPSLASFDGEPSLVFGTPGGDQQDQWQLVMFLRLVHGGMTLQQAIDAPLFHSEHVTASFYPRPSAKGHLMIEPGFGKAVASALVARGHGLEIAPPWSVGRLTAAQRLPNGMLSAGATPRLMQAYAVGR